jgi:hypothetical protein
VRLQQGFAAGGMGDIIGTECLLWVKSGHALASKQCPLYPKSGHSTPFVRLPCHHTRWPRFHDPNPKAYSIGHLAMRLMLSCRAVNRIAAQTYKPTFFVSFRRLPEKDKIHVVTDLGLHSSLGAIWACDAGTILLERP